MEYSNNKYLEFLHDGFIMPITIEGFALSIRLEKSMLYGM